MLPDGQIAQNLSIPRCENISLFRNSDLAYRMRRPARHEGRIAIVTKRGLGCGGRGGVVREVALQGGSFADSVSNGLHADERR